MNIQKLHAYVTTAFSNVRPAIDPIFTETINKVERDGRAVNIEPFVARLNVALKPFKAKISISGGQEPPGKRGEFYPTMLGFCEPPVRMYHQAKIEVVLCICDKTKRLALSTEAWGNFQYRLYQTLLHELVHKAQFAFGMKRAAGLVFKPHAAARLDQTLLDDQKYFGEIDEIESYARDCVEDWYYQNPHTKLTIGRIKREFQSNSNRLYTVRYYNDAYKGDLSHPALTRLFRKIALWNKLITPLAGSLMPCPTYVLSAPNITMPASAQQ